MPEVARMTGAEGASEPRYTRIVVRGASFTGVGYVFTQAVMLVSYVVLARLAGPSVFGAFAAAWILVGVGTLFAESGMSAALIQRKDRLEEAAATAMLATLAAGVGLSAIALAASPLVGLYFHDREIGLLAAALSGVLFLNAVTVVPDALMRRRFSYIRLMIVDPLNALTYGLAGAIALAAGMGAWGLVLSTYVAGVVRVTAVLTLGRWVPKFKLASFAMWRELARYARHVVTGEIFREIGQIASTALLGRFLGTAPLGEYRFGWRMATQAGLPVVAASAHVLLPAFSRIAHEVNRFRSAFLRSTQVVMALVLPVSFALVPLGEPAMTTLLGSSWTTAGRVLAALAGVTAALPAIALATEAFKAADRPDLLPRMSFLLTASTLAFLGALLHFGAVAVGGGMSLAYGLTAAYAFAQVARILSLPLRSFGGALAGPVAAAAGMTAVLYAFKWAWELPTTTSGQLVWLAASVVVAVAAYAALLGLVARTTARELVHAVRVLRTRTVAAAPLDDAQLTPRVS
jgi:O-antigen/teichoic acid export membrane protein